MGSAPSFFKLDRIGRTRQWLPSAELPPPRGMAPRRETVPPSADVYLYREVHEGAGVAAPRVFPRPLQTRIAHNHLESDPRPWQGRGIGTALVPLLVRNRPLRAKTRPHDVAHPSGCRVWTIPNAPSGSRLTASRVRRLWGRRSEVTRPWNRAGLVRAAIRPVSLDNEVIFFGCGAVDGGRRQSMLGRPLASARDRRPAGAHRPPPLAMSRRRLAPRTVAEPNYDPSAPAFRDHEMNSGDRDPRRRLFRRFACAPPSVTSDSTAVRLFLRRRVAASRGAKPKAHVRQVRRPRRSLFRTGPVPGGQGGGGDPLRGFVFPT